MNGALDDANKRLQNLMSLLELGETPAAILKRIRGLEVEIEQLTAAKKYLSGELKSAEISTRYLSEDIGNMLDLIKQFHSLDGDDAFMIRAGLAEHIRHFIKIVKVFPAGTLTTPEEIVMLRTELIQQGFSEDRIDSYLKQTHRTAPLRTGTSGRARYVSPREVGRHLIIEARNGHLRTVYPDLSGILCVARPGFLS